MKKTFTFLAIAVLLAGCVTPAQTTHEKMAAIDAKYKAQHINYDNWSAADKAEFQRLLQLEMQGK